MLENHKPIKELYLSSQLADKAKKKAVNFISWDLTPRQICDLELLLNGGFYPLKGFLDEVEYNSVLDNMKLKDGSLWPIPITLDVSKEFAADLKIGETVALKTWKVLFWLQFWLTPNGLQTNFKKLAKFFKQQMKHTPV